jgi:multiple sugar transport system substrate-binding protein
MKLAHFLPAFAFAAALSTAVGAAELVINADQSEGAPRQAWEAMVEKFRQENPDIEVQFNVYDRESYKKSVRNWLTGQAPDVIFWYVGTRMRQFSAPGLLEDVSALFTDQVRADLGAAVDNVTDGGMQFGVPYTFYHWGMYYRKDLFEQAGAAVPKDWAGLLDACAKLKDAGIAPIAIGSKDLWPTAGWFDYINMRLNGYAFHMELMTGKVPYTDGRVTAVFDKWAEALNAGCFVENHASVTWQESQGLLYSGKAATMLMGNFLTAGFPADVADKMDFFPFPVIDPAQPPAEDAPMDSIHIPAQAANKEEAKKFLAFVLRADVQQEINAAIGQIPVNKNAAVKADRFLKTGQALLANAQGIGQFFDRDTSEDLATIAMKGFQEFMVKPERAAKVQETIEKARQRIYGSN